MIETADDILVVDDDPDVVEVMRTILDVSGYEVRSARNGKEAVESVAQKMPGVVLLDMMMPVMNGRECAQELRARYGQVPPIIVVTAAEHARARADEVDGADDVLAKPFDMDDLLRIVARYVHKHHETGKDH